jgi:hypothetical protein
VFPCMIYFCRFSHLRIFDKCYSFCTSVPIPVAVRCEAYFCSRSIVGIAGSIPRDGLDVRVFCCVLRRQRPVRWADHSYRGVLPGLCVRSRNLSSGAAWAPLGLLRHGTNNTKVLSRSQHAVGQVFGELGPRSVYVRE